MRTFQIFEQHHPRSVGKDNGMPVYEANFEAVGRINADDYAEAIGKARRITPWPVVQEVYRGVD